MEIDFFERLPDYVPADPILISGAESKLLGQNIYLLAEDGQHNAAYEIRYEYHASPFRQVEFLEGVLAVGHEEYFYLFDTNSNTDILRLEMEGYFGSFHLHEGLLYVADATGIWCIKPGGKIVWHNQQLGIDGVIIGDIMQDEIKGQGEWDPPGGWKDFEINRHTGETIINSAANS